jgi:hypothetical protein
MSEVGFGSTAGRREKELKVSRWATFMCWLKYGHHWDSCPEGTVSREKEAVAMNTCRLCKLYKSGGD